MSKPQVEQEKPEESNLMGLEIQSPSDLYNQALETFESLGARVIFDYSAKSLGFHTLYKFESLNKVTSVKGLNFPNNFKMLIPADTKFLAQIQKDFLNKPIEEELREFSAPLILYQGGRSSDVIDHSLALETLKAIQYNRSGCGEYHLGIA